MLLRSCFWQKPQRDRLQAHFLHAGIEQGFHAVAEIRQALLDVIHGIGTAGRLVSQRGVEGLQIVDALAQLVDLEPGQVLHGALAVGIVLGHRTHAGLVRQPAVLALFQGFQAGCAAFFRFGAGEFFADALHGLITGIQLFSEYPPKLLFLVVISKVIVISNLYKLVPQR